LTCGTCRGTSRVTCSTCSGNGKVTCGKCSGQGKLCTYDALQCQWRTSEADSQHGATIRGKPKSQQKVVNQATGFSASLDGVSLQDEVARFPWDERKVHFDLLPAAQTWLENTLSRCPSNGILLAQSVGVKVLPILSAVCEVQAKEYNFWAIGEERLVLLDKENSSGCCLS